MHPPVHTHSLHKPLFALHHCTSWLFGHSASAENRNASCCFNLVASLSLSFERECLIFNIRSSAFAVRIAIPAGLLL